MFLREKIVHKTWLDNVYGKQNLLYLLNLFSNSVIIQGFPDQMKSNNLENYTHFISFTP